jgi:hypothetical protein
MGDVQILVQIGDEVRPATAEETARLWQIWESDQGAPSEAEG